MSYAFRKLYADVVLEDGTVCVLYQAWARLFGRWHARSGLEAWGPDGRHRRWLGRPPPLVDPGRPGRLVVSRDEGDLVLELDGALEGFAPPPPAACPWLSWSVLVPRARARLSGPPLGRLEGEGYADWVELSRPTRRLGFRELRWGRAHVGARTLVFTDLSFEDDRRWAVGATWGPPGVAAAGSDEVVTAFDAEGRGEVRVGTAAATFDDARVLHAGDAFGAGRVARPLDRLVARAYGGRTDELRWAGAARLDGRVGRALWERVRFGGGRPRLPTSALVGAGPP